MMLIDLAIFQGIWWVAALWGNAALLVLVLLLGLHFLVLNQTIRRDVLAMCLIAPVGWGIDLSLQAFGFWDLHSPLPFWLLVIWAGFVLTLFYSLAWLQKLKPIYQALIGGIAGSLSYFAGAKVGALSFNYSVIFSFLVVCVIWLVLLPLLVYCVYLFKNQTLANTN
ncbi:MAG TPA: DUF2878 domain-containing protein [Thiolinea sp.]|nr:DUF2878 domain-containing protein [Thiolinea sp.]